MTGLSCSPTRRTPSASGSNVCQARGKSAWYVPPPSGSVQPQAGSASGRSVDRTVAVPPPPGRPTKTEKPSAATGAKACLPTSRCQRAKSPRCVRPMLPVPSPPIGIPAYVPSSIIGRSTRGWPASGQGRPIGRCQATPGIFGHAPSVGHLSTPVTTTPRMKARWARKNTTTGTAMVISAVAWIRVGWVE